LVNFANFGILRTPQRHFALLLTLLAGSTINGDVVAYSAADMLVLGGRANSCFDVSQIGATAQYQGFGVFEKTGTSTWTLTGTTNSLTPWAIDGGTLAVSADDNLGAASGGLSFAGGTLQFLSSFTTSRAVTLNAGGGNFDTDGNNATLAGFISGSGGLTKVGAGVLTLSDTNSYSGGTSLDGGTLDLAALDAAGTNTIIFAKGGEILKIENAALSADTFGNTINRFGIGDAIDLAGIGFGARTTLGYSENSSGTGGTLTVSDGADAAAITLLGHYMASSFVTAADGHGGTLITEASQTASQQPLLTLPHA
jgi:autotransporter-associated beta strand protein